MYYITKKRGYSKKLKNFHNYLESANDNKNGDKCKLKTNLLFDNITHTGQAM